VAERVRTPLRIGDACRYLGVTRTTLLQAEARGEVVATRTPGGHRRYDPDHLDGVLARWSGVAPSAATIAVTDPRPHGPHPPIDAGDTAAWVRADLPSVARFALRQLVHVVGVHAGGLWLTTPRDAEPLRFCGGFRLPRWLGDRLARTPPAPSLIETLRTDGYRMGPSDGFGVPGEVVGGQALAVPTPGSRPPGSRPIGVVVVFADDEHRWSPEELRVLRDVQPLVAELVEQALAVDRLVRTLAEVRRLTDG
jgi:excisionase family DNA binding protein